MPLKLISLNIEGSKHLQKIRSFLEKERPEVLCLQELCEVDVPFFETLLGMSSFFVPMAVGKQGPSGVGIFATVPFVETAIHRYGGAEDGGGMIDGSNKETLHTSQRFALARAVVEHEGERFQILTTHFPVTKQGQPTDYQRDDMRAVLAILAGLGDFVLAGDFNAPRILGGHPGEIFGMLASAYTDSIPATYETSLDLTLHRAVGQGLAHEIADKMVDGLFTTPGYVAHDVRLHAGVSDHQAIVATITQA